MKTTKTIAGTCILLGLIPLLVTSCGREVTVSFALDVRPILAANCLECHHVGGEGQLASGFDMDSYTDLMKGTRFGPMIIAGDAEGSNLVVLMEGRADPSIAMPHGNRQAIAKEDVETIRAWIDQGARDN